ncbi:MAG: radical SAM protein [Candidatus Eremiobacteraeota bacterium]|nr:radical SAM protein [Candidatus Eremiobacteraeota bacterium]
MGKEFTTVLTTFYGAENAGIRYLSAALRKAGHKVFIVFFREWRNNNVTFPPESEFDLYLKLVKDLGADLLGLSFISPMYSIAKSLTERVKRELAIPVIWGGIHATSAPEKCLETADMICIGEGDDAIVELVEKMEKGEDITAIENLWFRREGQIVKNSMRPLVEDLDRLPYPDIDDEGKYLVDEGRVTSGEPTLRGAEYRIYATRGCPYNCSYCYNSILRRIYKGKGKYYRHKSVPYLIGELLEVKKRFPRLKRVKLDDDTAFALDHVWIDEFCKEYREKIAVPLECLLNPHLLKRDILESLKSAGLVKIQVGIESGSKRETREIFNRTPGNAQILRFGELNRELKIEVVYDAIIDNPFATEEDKREMLEFLLVIPRPYKLYLYSLNYFPGTKLTEELLAKGIIREEDVEGFATKSWRQFRVSMDYPRPKEEVFWLSLYLLVSKNFIPRSLIRWLSHSSWLRSHPGPLFSFAKFCNLIRMLEVAWEMFTHGELTLFKIKQYGSYRKMISQ